jgi:lipopolysaccharide export system protein LptA
MTHHPSIKLLFLCLSFLPALAFALPSDREQPINIEADHAQLDDEQGVTQYKGNAILTQGTLRITGDIITFYYDENQQIKKAIATGNLATYKQIHKPGEEPVRARALQMEYHAKIQKIYLIGKGHVWQQGDEFSGNHIEYDIARNIVHANSAPVQVGDKTQKSGRVHIIIQPPGSKKATKPAAKPEKQQAKPAPVTTTEPQVEQTSSSKKADDYLTGTTTTHLNLRTGPSTQYEKLGVFPPNTQVIILTQQKDWVQIKGRIKSEAMIGWVSRRYLTISK